MTTAEATDKGDTGTAAEAAASSADCTAGQVQARVSRGPGRRQDVHDHALHVRHVRQRVPGDDRNRFSVQDHVHGGPHGATAALGHSGTRVSERRVRIMKNCCRGPTYSIASVCCCELARRFRSLIPSYIRDSSVAVVVYDITSTSSRIWSFASGSKTCAPSVDRTWSLCSLATRRISRTGVRCLSRMAQIWPRSRTSCSSKLAPRLATISRRSFVSWRRCCLAWKTP
uniref:Uncharacterized protein n=1 Tax=Hyaloperonospora arabidopsidis (strain Emoy2) TaxID=559515 RepID=M4BF77_HYAAE